LSKQVKLADQLVTLIIPIDDAHTSVFKLTLIKCLKSQR